MHRVRVLITGRVQGVGFRYFALHRATQLGLAGRVRNLPGGAVEVDAEGEREPLGRLVEALREGPRAARVDAVDERWSEGPPRHDRFEIA